MFERLITFLSDLSDSHARDGLAGYDDPRVAAVALLFHVMDADGERRVEETLRLREAVSEAYGVSGRDLAELMRAGENADHDAVDLYAFTSVLKRHLNHEGCREFIRIMWEIVYADGELHELEDNVVWRVAELIGVEQRDRVLLRQEVQEGMAAARGETGDE